MEKWYWWCWEIFKYSPYGALLGVSLSLYLLSDISILDISNWDTSKVTDMRLMFYDCTNLTTIIGIIDMKSCDYYDMFTNCDKLTGVKLKNVPSGFNASEAGLKAGQYTIVS